MYFNVFKTTVYAKTATNMSIFVDKDPNLDVLIQISRKRSGFTSIILLLLKMRQRGEFA
jgi:hypothetical protein